MEEHTMEGRRENGGGTKGRKDGGTKGRRDGGTKGGRWGDQVRTVGDASENDGSWGRYNVRNTLTGADTNCGEIGHNLANRDIS